MPILEWRESFNLGIELLDTQHRHMHALLNDAYDEFVENSNTEALNRALHELIKVIDHHFLLEVELMEKTGYTQWGEHQEQHRSFVSRAEVIRNDLAKGWKNLPLEVVNFLENWLTYHFEAGAGYALFVVESQWKKYA